MNTQRLRVPTTLLTLSNLRVAPVALGHIRGKGDPTINNQAMQKPKARFALARAPGVQLSWLAATFLLALLAISAEAASTQFNPATHGFQFNNTFVNDAIKELDVRTKGLCGGMTYAAADFYFARKVIPRQDYRPAVNTALHDYIYGRQGNALQSHLDKWAELNVNPFGARDAEFFGWGLNQRLQELRQRIDAGRPVPLGLQHYGGGLDNLGLNHYVLAIGYHLGRYKGDGGAFAEDLRIFVYDPNVRGEVRTLAPSISRKGFYFVGDSDSIWRTYFVDTNYQPMAPPNLPSPPPVVNDGLVREVRLAISTGDDDLRGGSDNVNVVLHFRTWSHFVPLANGGRRWIANYDQTLSFALPQPVSPTEITGVTLNTTLAGDNWNVNKLEMFGVVNGRASSVLMREGNPLLFRFTGSAQAYSASVTPLALGQFEGTGYALLPNAVAGRSYRTQLFSGGCQGKITAASGFPSNSGLTLDDFGLIAGTPAANAKGEFKLTFQVTDGCQARPVTKSGTATLRIFEPLTLGQFEGTGYTGLPNAATGRPYDAQLFSGGCQARVTTSTLPSNLGLGFGNLGRISGTPSPNVRGELKFTFQVIDGCLPEPVTKTGSASLKIVDVISPIIQSAAVERSSLDSAGGEVEFVVKATDNIGVAVVMGIFGKPDGTSSGFHVPFNATTKDWRWKWTMPSNTGSTALTYTVKGRVSDEAGHLVESAPVTVTVAGRTSTPLLRPPKPPTFP